MIANFNSTDGAVHLLAIQDPPPGLRAMYTLNTPYARQFRNKIRHYNCALAFTSINYTKGFPSLSNTG